MISGTSHLQGNRGNDLPAILYMLGHDRLALDEGDPIHAELHTLPRGSLETSTEKDSELQIAK